MQAHDVGLEPMICMLPWVELGSLRVRVAASLALEFLHTCMNAHNSSTTVLT